MQGPGEARQQHLNAPLESIGSDLGTRSLLGSKQRARAHERISTAVRLAPARFGRPAAAAEPHYSGD